MMEILLIRHLVETKKLTKEDKTIIKAKLKEQFKQVRQEKQKGGGDVDLLIKVIL